MTYLILKIGIVFARLTERVKNMSNVVLVTNNDVVQKNYGEKMVVELLVGATLLETLEVVRDMIHRGHKLLTHPLSGSVKPNDTPYKTVVMGKAKGKLDYEGLSIIEESISSTQKFLNGRPTPKWTDKVKKDFKTVDYSIISTAIRSMDGKFIG